jgi:hypothetical protein
MVAWWPELTGKASKREARRAPKILDGDVAKKSGAMTAPKNFSETQTLLDIQCYVVKNE